MRCDASEAFFSQLIDGALAPRQVAAVRAHLAACARCSVIFEELRVIDALLLAPRKLEPPENFTIKTMVEIRSLPPPKPARSRWPWLFAVYLMVSWLGIGALLTLAHPNLQAGLALALTGTHRLAAAVDGIAHVVGTGFGLGYAGIAGIVTLLLLFDVLVLCFALLVRGVVRPRLAAHLARSEAV